jgi:c-di-GMP-binding flagellar brake protein YcgR
MLQAIQEPNPAAPEQDSLRVTQPAEMGQWLRQMREQAVPVVLSGPDGTAYSTRIWSFDAEANRLALAAQPHDPQPQRLVDQDEAWATAFLPEAQLQFELRGLVLVHGADGCALQAHYPRQMLRQQRRQSYRLRLSDRHGPTVRLRHPAMPDMQLALRVLDVSIGGCALLLPPNVPPLEAGTQLNGVRVELDLDTEFRTGIELQVISSQVHAAGHRLGCEWLSMEASAQRALQRYIDNAQKRRRQLAPCR